MPTTTKMTDISAACMNTRTSKSLVKSAKGSSLFGQFVYLCAKYWLIIYAENQDSLSNFEFTARV